MDLRVYLEEEGNEIERALGEKMPSYTEDPQVLHVAMRYSVLGGGKRLRAVLCRLACEAVGGDKKDALGYACALEMVHAYSLIHDDLPCMDDDVMRRGKPTNHRVFGEAVAVLAGDALIAQAFNEVAAQAKAGVISPTQGLELVAELAEGIGSKGLVAGQVVDLASEGKAIGAEVLDYIHTTKTGALFRACLRGGGIIGGASIEELCLLTEYSHHFGLAFQITDDILDVVGTEAVLGKSIGKDKQCEKTTYVRVYGLERSKEMAEEHVKRCKEISGKMPGNQELLGALASFVLERKH